VPFSFLHRFLQPHQYRNDAIIHADTLISPTLIHPDELVEGKSEHTPLNATEVTFGIASILCEKRRSSE
jgi:hypothetical protein